MKRKNKIILFSIIIALIIILVLIEVFRVRKKNIETIGGEYQQAKTACPECGKGELRISYEKYPVAPHLMTDECYGTIETCSNCWYWRSYDVHPHEFGDWETSGKQTCTEGQVAKRVCKNCGYDETDSKPALGHNYTKYEDIGDGKNHKAICSRCGYVATEAHTLKDVNYSQTCVTPEGAGKQCTKCNYKNFTETKKPTGHKYGIGTHKIT